MLQHLHIGGVLRLMISTVAVLSPISVFAGGMPSTIGSSLDNRGILDSGYSDVYLYEGGSFAPNTQISSFSFYDSSSGGVITPILLSENVATQSYTIVGVGTSQTPGNGLNTFAFGLQEGSDIIPATGTYTFGFSNTSEVNGVNNGNSAGTVTWSPDGGPWGYTNGIYLGTPGTTYGPSQDGIYYGNGRTYSAQATANPVPEPASLLVAVAIPFVALRRSRKSLG